MKYFVLAALVATSQAIRLRDSDLPAVARSYNSDNEPVPSKFVANNQDVLRPDWIEKRDMQLVQTEARHWNEGVSGKPETNRCANDNKATGVHESCDTEGNSAWNTYSSAITANPTKAQAAPYPSWPSWP